MNGSRLLRIRGHQLISRSEQLEIDLQTLQDRLYSFLLEIVKSSHPRDVLSEFKHLFIDPLEIYDTGIYLGIYQTFIGSHELEFRNTIKRCCYILINNWESARNHQYIKELVKLFAEYNPREQITKYPKINIFRSWLKNFINSDDYRELKLFIAKYEEQSKEHWVNRYRSYLLIAQALNENNPIEQKEAAKKLAQKLKSKYKFELAMYIAHSQSNKYNATKYRNPSILGENVLRLIKSIVIKKGIFSYPNIANIFIKQTHEQNFQEFKESLEKYLIFSLKKETNIKYIRQQLSDKLFLWKQKYHDCQISKGLILRTSTKVIDFLTTENGSEPSPMFLSFLGEGHPLTLVIMLLKIILICKNARNHLEMRIGNLITCYENYSEEECKAIINFIEIFNITFAIYADNVEYNLINMQTDNHSQVDLDAYHVFSLTKKYRSL